MAGEVQAMSDARLAEIRQRADNLEEVYQAGEGVGFSGLGYRDVHSIALAYHEDVAPLLAEVERLRAREAALVAVVRAVATSNPYGSWLPPTNSPAGVVCRWCMERAYTPAQCQHDLECTWQQARASLRTARENA